MALATIQEWLADQAALRHIADIDGDGAPDSTAIQAALDKAEAEIEGWLASRYPVAYPAAAAATLRLHAIAIATHHLAATAQASTDAIEAAWKASCDYLKTVAAGRADLPGTVKAGDVTTPAGDVQVVSPDRVFSRDSLKGM